ncbi:uncharacterized protein LOC106640752 [Copidosoma floridanum]|uniref:uncharacterized protein LOC106640752 n=1 Tax=Copidosoma floridanum TaxID=29053 RepID=UPI0006C97BFA|nr:uncharacterized protein LOC106640752 [Copidosoma floridanum]
MILDVESNHIGSSGIVIELHGNVKPCSTFVSDYEIGDIFFKKNSTTLLQIGNSLLEGRVTNSTKSIVILKKDNENFISTNKPIFFKNFAYSIDCIIDKKLVFRSRPKPLHIKKLY